MSTHDLTSYKKAKVIAKDLSEVRSLLRECYKKLVPYKKYIPVKSVLNELLNAECITKLYNEKYNEVIKNKSNIDEIE